MKRSSVRSMMLQFARVIHEAIGIESPKVFIAAIGFVFLLFGLFIGWAIDRGYRVKLAEDAKRNLPPQTAPPPSSAEESRSIRIEQRSEGPDSPNTAVIGDNNEINVNPPLNPNAPITVYDFNGVKHIQRGNSFRAEAGEELAWFQQVLKPLNEQRNWPDLLKACEEQIPKSPDWLTPHLYAGIALANMDRKSEAIERLRFVDERAAGDSAYSDAGRNLRILESQ